MITLIASLYFFIAGMTCEYLATKHKDDHRNSTTLWVVVVSLFWPCYLIAKVWYWWQFERLGEGK